MVSDNYNDHMRRALFAALLAVSSIGFFTLPAGAMFLSSAQSSTTLSFSLTDNSSPASASGGPFNIMIDVLPRSIPGAIRIVAVAPDGSGDSNLVCGYRDVLKGQVECAFNFTSAGIWSIHVQMTNADRSNVLAWAVTNLRVTN